MKRSSASTSIRRVSSARCSAALQRLAEGAALDLLAQPAPLLVGGDVLDLVGDRAAVGVAQAREGLGERLALDEDVQQPRGDLRHQRRRQADRLRVERRVAARRRAERVERRGEMAVGAQRAHERVGGRGGLQQLLARALRRAPAPAAGAAAAAAAPAAARAARRAPRRRPRRSRRRRRAAPRCAPRKRPDSAPWMMRWS